MPSLMFRSAGHMLFYVSSLVLITNMVGLAMASSFVASINPFSPANFIDTFTPGHYAIPMTDNKGNKHDMIISTVSLDTWFATKSSICPGTIYETSGCGWNPKALYNPTGASTSRTSCSIGVKYPTDKYTECYSIMPNISIMLGDNSAATPDLQLYADVGFLLNSTWDGSQQSGMLGLAAAVGAGYGSTDPSNPILLDISTRYSPQNAQFTLAFNRGPETGGWFTVGSVLPPHALPLTDPAVFQTPMEMATFNGRVNDLYVVTVSLTVLTAPSIQEQYIIDSGDIYLRVPTAVAHSINSAWNPAGTPMNDGSGRWTVACNAAAPAIGLTIGGHTFAINKADLIVEEKNVCWSSVIDELNGPFVLGWPLLLNVVVSFNLENRIMYWQEPPAGEDLVSGTAAVGPSATVASKSSSSTPVSTPSISATTSGTPHAISPSISASSSTVSSRVSTLVTSAKVSSTTVPTIGSVVVTTSSSSVTSAVTATPLRPSAPVPVTTGSLSGTTTTHTLFSSTTILSVVHPSASSA